MKRETGRRVQQLLFVVVVSCLLFTLPMYLEADTEIKSSETTTQQSKLPDKQDNTNNKDGTITIGISIMSAAPTLAVCLGYFALILLARYFWIILPNNRYLQTYAEEVRAQFAIEQDKPDEESKVEKAIKPEILFLQCL